MESFNTREFTDPEEFTNPEELTNTEELTIKELTQMLAEWTIPVPTDRLRNRIFGPVEITQPWHRRHRNMAAGFLIQMAAVASVFLLFQPARTIIAKHYDPKILLNPWQTKLPGSQKAAGGGGGGQHAQTPAARGVSPRFAARPFLPPAVATVQPKLAVVPAISAPAPEIQAANYDDPLSRLSGTSGGQGINGFGDGKGGGIGKGVGNGLGDGMGGGSGGGIYTAGGDVSSPVVLFKVEPEYSEEARKAKYSGSVRLSVVIDEHGIPTNIRVITPQGLGLDEKAVQAVQHWLFRPGFRNGRPVRVQAYIEVIFRLL